MKLRNRKEVNIKNFYKEFLKHISNTLPEHRRLTDMEREVLTEFWILEGDLAEVDRFSTSIKRYIREDVFNFKHYAGLENYITKLINKGFILVKGKKKFINPIFDLSKEKIRADKNITLVYEFDITE